MLYADDPVPRLATVQPDSIHGGEFTHSEDQFTEYQIPMDWWQNHTLDSGDSRDLIHSVIRQL